jgi:hypothetical protein
MTIEEVRSYAKERGIPEKRVEVLVAELHPDENGKLSTEESIEAVAAIDYVSRLREDTLRMIEEVRALRKQRGKA